MGWYFLLEAPIVIFALIIGAIIISNPAGGFDIDPNLRSVWRNIDFSGLLALVVAVSIQLVGLSLGGNELPWSGHVVATCLVGSFALLGVSFIIEAKTNAIPIIPQRMLQDTHCQFL
jgi:hypothetical protein